MAEECRFGCYSIPKMRPCSPGKKEKRTERFWSRMLMSSILLYSLTDCWVQEQAANLATDLLRRCKKVHYSLPVASTSQWVKQRSKKHSFSAHFRSNICCFRLLWKCCGVGFNINIWCVPSVKWGAKPDGMRQPSHWGTQCCRHWAVNFSC